LAAPSGSPLSNTNRGQVGAGLIAVTGPSDANVNPPLNQGRYWSSASIADASVAQFDALTRLRYAGGSIMSGAGSVTNPTNVWIDYDSTTQIATSYISSTFTKPGTPFHTASVNLNAYGSGINLGAYASTYTAGTHGGYLRAMRFECDGVGCCVVVP
jgi:hypothetical protein